MLMNVIFYFNKNDRFYDFLCFCNFAEVAAQITVSKNDIFYRSFSR